MHHPLTNGDNQMAKVKECLTYQCKYCKKGIEIIPENFPQIIYKNPSYFHKRCYKQYLEEKINKAKRKDSYNRWKNEYKNARQLSNETQDRLQKIYDKDRVIRFIRSNYPISIIPTHIYTKLDSVYYGTFKGMDGVTISPGDLLFMWQKMMPKLNRIYADNKSKGKEMNDVQRISYDISVLVGNYDNYCRWKVKQETANEIEEKDVAINTAQEAIKYDNIINQSIENNSNNVVIADVVDSIFDKEEEDLNASSG